MPAVNPYQRAGPREGEAPTGTMVHGLASAYTVPSPPDSMEPGYDHEDAPQLGWQETPSSPDPIRIGRREPPVNDPNDREYTARREADRFARQADEVTHESWNVQQHTVAPAQNPLWEQPRMHIRPSAVRSPLGYMFERPWLIPRVGKDIVSEDFVDHISMADHRRVYEIYGMRTSDRVGTNTFRLDPQPWDRNLFPPDQTMSTPTSSGAQTGNRSYRL